MYKDLVPSLFLALGGEEKLRRRRRGSEKGLLYKCIYATCTSRGTRKKGKFQFP
jgi:hypothetical protein